MDGWFLKYRFPSQKKKLDHHTMESTDKTDTPAWELYKENAQPLKRGRDTKKLGLSLAAQATGVADPNVARMAEFETMVIEEALANSDDPLAVWIKFINFVRDAYPASNGSSKVVPIIERCIRQLSQNSRYHNDERFIKV
jgi:checkpoint serine/threonine-protein kinase